MLFKNVILSIETNEAQKLSVSLCVYIIQVNVLISSWNSQWLNVLFQWIWLSILFILPSLYISVNMLDRGFSYAVNHLLGLKSMPGTVLSREDVMIKWLSWLVFGKEETDNAVWGLLTTRGNGWVDVSGLGWSRRPEQGGSSCRETSTGREAGLWSLRRLSWISVTRVGVISTTRRARAMGEVREEAWAGSEC